MVMSGIAAFFVDNRAALIFYAVLVLIIVLLRRKIEWQGFGIGLYKTKVGLRLMDSWGRRHKGLVQTLGYIGLGVGFIGMAVIAFVLLKGLVDTFMNPVAPPVLSPVIPGFTIWGQGLKVPLITGWLALFVVIVIHEFSHGVVARAHGIKVKSSGLLIFGPIAGAFVEPDEKAVKKQSPAVQYSLFAAGPWSNVLSAGIFMLVAAYLVAPLVLAMTAPGGAQIGTVSPGMPAANASLMPGMVITSVDGTPVRDYQEMSDALDRVGVGERITLGTKADGDFALVTSRNPDNANSTRGYLGVTLTSKRDPAVAGPLFAGLLAAIVWLQDFLSWIVILSLGIGLANLLPLGPVDGGRMLQTAAREITGDEKRGDWWWTRVSIATLALIIVLLAVPLARSFF